MEEEPWTCGLGLASRSTLPGTFGRLLAASARILENHMRALDPADADARLELDAYAALVTRQRDVAEQLSGISDQMAGHRTLPMAPHDEAAMSDSAALTAFAEFVRLEQEVVTLLQGLLQEDEQMLQEMTETG
ncbi:hypothetical protein E1218_25765 [Kribbella turkmenica]|uniref:Uncharacterized protein n=1 Tax=Kribbella turkmenica TaxID=2530375 RepID=A0A4R4WHG0_9ACTN|nr:hypothetical protein [Kribbella turkmenica]TDD18598.1 hypothetical protein E1218_25765 [Kribbella turkmenica]